MVDHPLTKVIGSPFTQFIAGKSKEQLDLIDHLNSISSNDELPDLIVLDQNMPKMNGKQTLQFLKSHERFSKIPAIIYSTYTGSSLIVECTELGANMVAVKPIDDEGYQKMMNDFLQVFSG